MPNDNDSRRYDNLPRQGDAVLLQGGIDDIKREQAEQKERDEEYRKHDRSYKDQQTQLTFWLVVIGLAGTFVSIWNSTISRKASIAAESAATTALNALQRDINDAPTRAQREAMMLGAIQDSAAAAKDSASTAKTSADASGRQADASLRSVREMEKANRLAANSIDNALATSRQEQRAMIQSPTLQLSAEPTLKQPPGGETSTITFRLINIGKTTALNVRVKSFGAFSLVDTPMPPAELIWDSLPATAPIALFSVSNLGLGTLRPDVFQELPFTFVENNALLYRERKTTLYFWTYITYEDAFGSHWTKTCSFRQFGQPLDKWKVCPFPGSNDADR